MLRIKVTGLNNANKAIQRKVDRLVEKVSDDVLVVARDKTPIRLGKARNGWKKRKLTKGAVIENRVIYIDKLDQGSSRQAPRGIVGPTIAEIKRRKY
jgi:hypothetical protein